MATFTGRVLVKLAAAFLGTAAVLLAADVTGTWKGNSEVVNRDGETRQMAVVMNLKQTAEQVTGTAGPAGAEPAEIQKGKVNGDKFTFEADDHGNKVEVTLTVGENTLRGEAKFNREYGVVTMKLDLRREAAN